MSPTTNASLTGIDAPSVTGRAVRAILLLAGFYLLTLGVATALLVAPVAFAWVSGWRNIRVVLFAFALCWIPAFLLLGGMFAVRRAPFQPRGRRLEREEAPELFAILDDLAGAASTAPPAEVYLTDRVDLSVTETSAGHRVLQIGAPILAWTTVEELRAGLAHELGHYAFGDTRLLGLVSWAHAAFRAVLATTTERTAFADTGSGAIEAGFAFAKAIGDALVQGYAKIFFWVMRRSDRRAELAADQLAGRLVGKEPAIRLLEKFAVAGLLHQVYLEREVAFALDAGGMPLDLTEGFAAFSTRMRERGLTAELEEAARTETTDPFDAHPALPVRVAALAGAPEPRSRIEDARIAASLVHVDLDAWMVESVLASVSGALGAGSVVTKVRWAEMPTAVFAPHCTTEARSLAARLFAMHPEASTVAAMLGAVVRDLGAGRLEPLAHHVLPELASVPPHVRARVTVDVVASVLRTLFSGALLERGATIDLSLGEPALLFRLGDASVAPALLARRSLEDGAASLELQRWAASLEASAAPSFAPAEPRAARPFAT